MECWFRLLAMPRDTHSRQYLIAKASGEVPPPLTSPAWWGLSINRTDRQTDRHGPDMGIGDAGRPLIPVEWFRHPS